MLELKGINKQLGDFRLKDINLEINEGEYFVILGPTGTGKTVILEVIAGMYRPDSGEIYFKNQKISSLYPEQRGISFVYQDYALFPHLSVEENIIFGLKVQNISQESIKKSLQDMVTLLGIEHLLQRYPTTLSGGEQQRVAIARALITSPQILLLDEPLSALDPRTRQVFQEELQNIHAMLGTTTIHITHDFSEALALGDRIAVLQDGAIVQVGTPAEVFHHPSSCFVAEFVGAENILSGQCTDGVIKVGPGVDIHAVSPEQGEVNLTIRPEDIIISHQPLTCSAQNSLPGTLLKMYNQGPLFRITIDSGVILTALLSKQAVEEMALRPGQKVWATFKASAVHVF
ncbi:MAG: ABC transporter ATP-binding protein [Syntrophomonadaceae bacterium]|nr:ABC transporter ATP-binding protein [Syntrophomonadaceae bacterium]